jgi:hypothetical protein
MSENEMSQQQRDAAVIAKYREWLPEYEAGLGSDWMPETDERMGELFEFIDEGSGEIIDAALRTIDRLTAINAEYAALATEYQNSDMGENELAERICGIRDRAALASASDGAGTDAGAPAGDADGGR